MTSGGGSLVLFDTRFFHDAPFIEADPGLGELRDAVDWANQSTDGNGSPHQGPRVGQTYQQNGREYYVYNMDCDEVGYGSTRYREGYAVGLTGARSYAGDPRRDYLLKLGVVCSPWSNKSWSDHWRFLRVITQGLFEKDDVDRLRTAWGGLLWDFINRAHLNLKPADTSTEYRVRPAPLKTCPPNYALRGMTVYYDTSSSPDPRVVGVESLSCTRVVDQGGPQLIDVFTSPNFSSRYEMTVDFGLPLEFPLRQDIGVVDTNLHSNGVQSAYIGCVNSNEVLSSLQVHRARPEDEFVAMYASCRPAPM